MPEKKQELKLPETLILLGMLFVFVSGVVGVAYVVRMLAILIMALNLATRMF